MLGPWIITIIWTQDQKQLILTFLLLFRKGKKNRTFPYVEQLPRLFCISQTYLHVMCVSVYKRLVSCCCFCCYSAPRPAAVQQPNKSETIKDLEMDVHCRVIVGTWHQMGNMENPFLNEQCRRRVVSRIGWAPKRLSSTGWIERAMSLKNISNSRTNLFSLSFLFIFLVVNNTPLWHYCNGYGRLYSYSWAIWLVASKGNIFIYSMLASI